MHIENVKITNFKGIESLGVDLRGRSVYVIGGNAAGKTSFISAIFCALTGKDIPPSPIKGTAKTGKIEVELDGYAVELEFKKKADGKVEKKLSLFSTEDGERIDSPRNKLDAIIGNLEFNPFEFMRMQPTPQLNYFCKVFGIKGINAINDHIEQLNAVATFDKKKLISLKDQLQPYDVKLLSQEEQSASDLGKAYAEAVGKNQQIETFKIKVDAEKDRLVELEKQIIECKEKIKQGEAWLSTQKTVDVTDIREKMDKLDETNKAIAEAKKQKQLHDEVDAIESSIEKCAIEKKEKIAEKKELIAAHTKAIIGFSYDDDLGFTLDGLPFHIDQNNTAAQIVAGLKLGAGLLGDVKIARFEGSLLDQENLDAVNEFALSQGLQLFVEIVDRNDKDLRLEFVEESQTDKQ
jgi:predicted ATP-dependent endonuclease of OLD family